MHRSVHNYPLTRDLEESEVNRTMTSDGSMADDEVMDLNGDTEEVPDVDGIDFRCQLKHTIDPDGVDLAGFVWACHMISENHLAVCMNECVRVFEVTTDLSYKVSSKDWRGREIRGVATSDSLPDNMLVICDDKPYIYLCPRHEATKINKKYKIQSDVRSPLSIAVNARFAVVKMIGQKLFILCKIPSFTHQTYVHLDISPYDMCISSDYLIVMGMKEMVVKSLTNAKKDVCKIQPPPGLWEFRNVTCKNNAREIYAGCRQGKNYCVYKYTWNGVGKPEYIISACIIGDLGCLWNGRLSVTSDGLLAVEQASTVKLYKLQ